MIRGAKLKLTGKRAQKQLAAGRIDVASLSAADRAKLLKALKTNGSKYGNERVKLDGYTFDSKLEADRYSELKLRIKAGEIERLRVHPVYPLWVDDVLVAKYEADFSYFDKRTYRVVIEDTKGFRTDVYKIKRALMRALYGIRITEIRKDK